MVKLFWWNITKISKTTLTDEERTKAEEIRALKWEAKKKEAEDKILQQTLERQQMLDSLKDLAKGKSSMEESLIMLIAPYLMEKFMGKGSNIPKQKAEELPFDVNEATDEQIEDILKKIPEQYIDVIKGKSDEELGEIIAKNQPNIKEETIERAIKIFKRLYPNGDEEQKSL